MTAAVPEANETPIIRHAGMRRPELLQLVTPSVVAGARIGWVIQVMLTQRDSRLNLVLTRPTMIPRIVE